MSAAAVLVGCVGFYLAVALFWWGVNSSEAKRQLGFARERQAQLDEYATRNQEFWGDATEKARGKRDENLDAARAAALDARRALYWLPWTLYGAARSAARVNREVAEIRTGRTDLDPRQRADRLAALEAETEELRREQEGDPPRPT